MAPGVTRVWIMTDAVCLGLDYREGVNQFLFTTWHGSYYNGRRLIFKDGGIYKRGIIYVNI